jgi:hypothetical protein
MEPNGPGARHNHMFADTAAIGAAGVELTRTAAEFDAIAAAMPAAAETFSEALGPIGSDFVSALASAIQDAAHQVTSLGADLARAADTAAQTAGSYVDTERRSIATLGG